MELLFLLLVQGYGLSIGLESSADLVINPGLFFNITQYQPLLLVQCF